MSWLLLLAMLLVVATLVANNAARKSARASGLPEGDVGYQDTHLSQILCETLVSTRYGLV